MDDKVTMKFIALEDLVVYRLSRELSKIAWIAYQKLDWKQQKLIGDQFLRSTDSIGANIAEGYSRFHFLDRVKFYYQARASLAEAANHWLPLLVERTLIEKILAEEYTKNSKELSLKLQNFIASNMRSKQNLK
jgi:four helix bundle protein